MIISIIIVNTTKKYLNRLLFFTFTIFRECHHRATQTETAEIPIVVDDIIRTEKPTEEIQQVDGDDGEQASY